MSILKNTEIQAYQLGHELGTRLVAGAYCSINSTFKLASLVLGYAESLALDNTESHAYQLGAADAANKNNDRLDSIKRAIRIAKADYQKALSC